MKSSCLGSISMELPHLAPYSSSMACSHDFQTGSILLQIWAFHCLFEQQLYLKLYLLILVSWPIPVSQVRPLLFFLWLLSLLSIGIRLICISRASASLPAANLPFQRFINHPSFKLLVWLWLPTFIPFKFLRNFLDSSLWHSKIWMQHFSSFRTWKSQTKGATADTLNSWGFGEEDRTSLPVVALHIILVMLHACESLM